MKFSTELLLHLTISRAVAPYRRKSDHAKIELEKHLLCSMLLFLFALESNGILYSTIFSPEGRIILINNANW